MRRTVLTLCSPSLVSSGFSSATFTSGAYGVDAHESDARMRRLYDLYGIADDGSNTSGASGTPNTDSSDAAAAAASSLASMSGSTQRRTTHPTRETYLAMTDDDLVVLLRTRVRQVRDLRKIYENFHYEADKCFRKMVLDYHDKALQLSAIHGKMQATSLQVNREVLSKLREEQEMLTREKRLIIFISIVFTTVFWVWLRRHYVRRSDINAGVRTVMERAELSPSVSGMGAYGTNLFGSAKRSARTWETSWEAELRDRREREAMPRDDAAT